MSPIRILVVDDHRLVRAGLVSVLASLPGIEVVGQAGTGREAIDWLRHHHADVVFLDVAMPDLNGLDAAERILQEHAGIKVIFLSVNAAEEYVLRAMRIGAAGYLSKNAELTELEQAIHAVTDGGTYLTPNVARLVADYVRRVGPNGVVADPLTPRQREVLQLIAEGRGTKDIAKRLGISVKTVETHRAQLMKELELYDVASLVRYAIRIGLVSPDG